MLSYDLNTVTRTSVEKDNDMETLTLEERERWEEAYKEDVMKQLGRLGQRNILNPTTLMLSIPQPHVKSSLPSIT